MVRLLKLQEKANERFKTFSQGRGHIDRKKLHILQSKSKSLDVEFIDLIIEEETSKAKQDDVDIAAKVAEAKRKLKTSVSKDGNAVVVNPPPDEPEEPKEPEVPEHVTKTAKKKVTRRTKANANSDKE